MLWGVKMKEISKIILLLLIGCVMFSIFSCKTTSIINFESEKFEKFKNGSLSLKQLPEEYYFARILTATCVDIVFFKFSKKNSFEDIFAKNVVVNDDNGNLIYKRDYMQFNSYNSTDFINNCHYKTYFYEIPHEELDRITLKNYKTEYIILSFEINGVKSSEKLKRVEKKYIVART